MKKMKKWIVALCTMVMVAGSVMSVNAGCEGWVIVDISDPYCATVGCNAERKLWMYVDYDYERNCKSEYGTAYTEHKTASQNPGCCP